MNIIIDIIDFSDEILWKIFKTECKKYNIDASIIRNKDKSVMKFEFKGSEAEKNEIINQLREKGVIKERGVKQNYLFST